MFCIIKWSWILFVKAETRWQRNPLRGILSDVLLRRRSLRIGWLTQIPHHFGCRFWGIINVKFWMINVKFYKKLCHIIFHKFLSISRCVRPVTYASWLSKKVPCFLQLQLLRTFVYLVGGYRFILFCISIVSGLESRGLSKLFIVNAKGLLKLILHFFLMYSYFLHSFLSFL